MTESNDFVQLKIVSDEDIEFLYEMLQERDDTVNVNHKSLPTFEEHEKFVKMNSYDVWYIILKDSQKIGHINLDGFEIGWFIKKKYQRFGFVVEAFKKLKQTHHRSKYQGKINPINISARIFLEKLNFKLKKEYSDYHLYELENILK